MPKLVSFAAAMYQRVNSSVDTQGRPIFWPDQRVACLHSKIAPRSRQGSAALHVKALNDRGSCVQLVEIVMDLGRPPLARFPSGDLRLADDVISNADLDHAISKVPSLPPVCIQMCHILLPMSRDNTLSARISC